MRSSLITQIAENIDPRQYAREGHSIVDALIYLLQSIHEATDTGECSARIFFADLSKGFDLIDHNILLKELSSLNIDIVLVDWIKVFFTDRRQVVRMGNFLSDWKSSRASANLTPVGGFPLDSLAESGFP